EQLEQQAGLPEADRLIPRQVEALEAIHAISEALVEGFGAVEGAKSVSVDEDVKRLKDGQNVSPGKLDDATRALDRSLERIGATAVAPKLFVAGLKAEFGITTPNTWRTNANGHPAWHSSSVLKMLEHAVKTHSYRDRVAIADAIKNMRDAINDDAAL